MEAVDLNAARGPHTLEALGEDIIGLCSCLNVATYRLLVMIREFDEERGWEWPGLVSCAHWLNFKCGIGLNAAREKVRVAHALKDLPKLSAAMERGELSYSKARAITRVATAENEDYLLMISRHGSAYHVETLIRKYRWARRLQDCETVNRQYEERFLEFYQDADGCLIIKGRIPADQAALIKKALEHAVDVTAETSKDEEQLEPVAARRADALAHMAETYLAAPETRGTGGDRYQLLVQVSTDGAQIDGQGVTAETARRLGCDCSRVAVEVGENGEPLSVGRKTRSIPPAIRRALRLRDQGCRFPGCTHQRFVDGHHIEHWTNGGETSLDNLVELCRHHHRLVHEGGYHCERRPDGEVVFLAPDESRLPRSMPPQPLEERAYALFEREMRHIDRNAAAPLWYAGETIDWDLAVGHLFQCAEETAANEAAISSGR